MTPREALEHVEAFASIDADGFDRLERIGAEVRFPEGTAVVSEGEVGDAFFVVLEGALEITARDFAGTPQPVARLGAGTVFGEGSALTGEPRSASVVAVEPVVALRFEMVPVFGVLKDYPSALEALRRLAVHRVETLIERVSET